MNTVFTREGMRVMPGVEIEQVTYADGRFTVTTSEETVEAEKLLVAAGRRTNLPDLGLETVGLDGEVDALETDGCLRVLRDGEPVEGLYAVGDIVGKGPFTHTAKYQSGIVIRAMLGQPGARGRLPRRAAGDVHRPRGRGGRPDRGAGSRGGRRGPGRAGRPAPSRPAGHMHGPGSDGLIKLVVRDGLLVGATSVGPSGGEVLSMLTLAVHAAGAGRGAQEHDLRLPDLPRPRPRRPRPDRLTRGGDPRRRASPAEGRRWGAPG